jgi:predicted nucleotidyltransferase
MINKRDCTVMVIAYEKLLAHLKERLVTELGTAIESIVLYGSVARNEAHEDSDIDILIITRDNDRKLQDRISKIRTQIDIDNNTLTTLVQMNKSEFKQHIKLSSPFIEDVLKEGIILYDRGFFEKICESLASEGYESIKVG